MRSIWNTFLVWRELIMNDTDVGFNKFHFEQALRFKYPLALDVYFFIDNACCNEASLYYSLKQFELTTNHEQSRHQ